MFIMSSFSANDQQNSLQLLVHCFVNQVLANLFPADSELFFQVIQVANPFPSSNILLKTYLLLSKAPCLFRLGESDLQFVPQLKYSGHIITHNLSDDNDIQREIRSTFVRCNVQLFSTCETETFSVVLPLFL